MIDTQKSPDIPLGSPNCGVLVAKSASEQTAESLPRRNRQSKIHVLHPAHEEAVTPA